MSDLAAVRIRRMSAADLERVLEIAESLPEAPHWAAWAYVAAMDAANVPRRIALVAERDSSGDWDWCEGNEKQTSGAEAHARLAESDAGTEVPAYQSPAYQSLAYESLAYQSPGYHRLRSCVVGFAVAAIVAGEAELETIAVAAEAEGQGRGVGGLLLQALVSELKTAQVSEVNLEVRASNQAALGFYLVQGFEESGRRRSYYSDPEEDAVLMRLRLT
jgi:[ribosomal protein S18]-alanine N-acetyltransferase